MAEIRCFNVDANEFIKNIADNFYDLAIVDPPYGLGNSVVNSGGRFKKYRSQNGNWDLIKPSTEYFTELFRVSKNQVIWGGNYFGLPASKCFLVWDKKQPEGISFAMCEYAWTSFDSVAQIFRSRTQCQDERFHPTQKPIELYRWILQKYAKKGQKILDTHGGSFSHAIAAEIEGFDLDICEIDKHYFDLGTERFEKFKLNLKEIKELGYAKTEISKQYPVLF